MVNYWAWNKTYSKGYNSSVADVKPRIYVIKHRCETPAKYKECQVAASTVRFPTKDENTLAAYFLWLSAVLS